MTLSLRYAARSDVGLLRDGNEDAGYAGPRLLAVADGMGGQAAGEVASATVIGALTHLDDETAVPALLDVLEQSVSSANEQLREMVEADPNLDGMGTTLTALYWTGTRMGIVHIGDSRAYLLRDGELTQITHDHTFVQSLLDEGRITAEQAAHHPHRSLIIRALDGRGRVELDLSVREVRSGDRYLVCSDGLSGVVSNETLERSLVEAASPDQAAAELVDLALRAGGPDNITCIVADLTEEGEPATTDPLLVGAAADRHSPRKPNLKTASGRAAAALARVEDGPAADDRLDPDAAEPWRRRHKQLVRSLALIVVLALIGVGGYFGYGWTQDQYYVGNNDGRVAIYRGLPDKVLGVELSSVYEQQDVVLTNLPSYLRDQVNANLPATDLGHARTIVTGLAEDAAACIEARRLASLPQPTPPVTGTPTATPPATTAPATTAPATTPATQPGGATPTPPTATSSITLGATPTSPSSPSPTPGTSVLSECGEAIG